MARRAPFGKVRLLPRPSPASILTSQPEMALSTRIPEVWITATASSSSLFPQPAFSPNSQSGTLFSYPGPTPSISANGAINGIVWALQNEAFQSNGPTVLHAYDATNLAKELYNSNQRPNRDNAGAAVKFTVPTIANGKVYVGSEANLTVFGLLPPDFTLGALPLAQSVKLGHFINYTLKIVAQGGYAGTVSLSVTGLPANSTAVIKPITVTTSGSATLQVRTTTTTPTGPAILTVTGTDSVHSQAHSATVTMTVTP